MIKNCFFMGESEGQWILMDGSESSHGFRWGGRIQAGKDRYQYIRLLSQVAFLEDMVNNWSHSLKSLETDDQTAVIAPSTENHQALTVESIGVEYKPNVEISEFPGAQIAPGGIPGSTAEVAGDIDLNVPACSNQGDGPDGSMAENSQLADIMTEADDVGVADRTNFTITDEMSPGKAVDVGVDNSTDSAINDEMSPAKAVDIIVDNQKRLETMDEVPPVKTFDVGADNRTDIQITQEMPQANSVSLNRKDPQNFPTEEGVNQDSPASMPLKSEVVCLYSCCSGCISTLQDLLKESIIREKEHLGSCCTVEDIHDLISSLSTNLCSTVRNAFVTGESRNPVYGKPDSGISKNSESQSSELTDCVCHSEEDVSEDLKSSSSYNQPGFCSRYIFRNGVLVSGIPEESSFHCKYNALSLSSLIELILFTTKQPTD